MTRRRVAVVSSCAPPLPGHPVTGGGLRTAQLIATLEAGKHSVVPFIDAGALPADAPEGLIRFTAASLAERLRAAKPSVLVLEQWALAALLGDPAEGGAPDVPVVIDLHGSLLLENVYRRGTLELVLDGKTKLDALHRADLLVTPAAAQLHHFSSWATLAGFDPRELPLALLPLATPSAVPPPRSATTPGLKLVYGGARWPWIDSLAALEVAAAVVEATPQTRLDVFTYDPPRHGLPFEEDLGTWPDVDAALRGSSRRIALRGRTAHADWLTHLRETATVALDLWEPNPERMLASTTRTIEFLASGLPVITTAGACWAEELVASGAGWTVPSGSGFRAALTALLTELAGDGARIAQASAAATALAVGRSDLRTTGAALLDFIDRPTRAPRARSVVAEIVSVRQAHLDETLRSHIAAHAAEHARLVAAHHAETAELRARHSAEVAEIRAAAQAELASARDERRAEILSLSKEHRRALAEREADSGERLAAQQAAEQTRSRELRAEHRAESDAIALAHREQLVEAQAAERSRAEQQRAAHRGEIEAMSAESRAQLAAAAEEARKERERAAKESDERLERATAEAARVAATNDARIAAQAAEAKGEFEALRARLEGLLADRQGELDLARATLTERTAELRLALERVDGASGRWTAEKEGLEDQLREAAASIDALRQEVTTRDAALRDAVDAHHAQAGRWTAEQAGLEDQLREALAARDALTSELAAHADALREAVEGRDTWKGRWTTDRASDKEERTRMQVGAQAALTSREAQLQREAERALEELRAQLQGELDAMAARKVVRLADSAQKALGGASLTPGGRIAPAARLARLWAEHALDRDRE